MQPTVHHSSVAVAEFHCSFPETLGSLILDLQLPWLRQAWLESVQLSLHVDDLWWLVVDCWDFDLEESIAVVLVQKMLVCCNLPEPVFHTEAVVSYPH